MFRWRAQRPGLRAVGTTTVGDPTMRPREHGSTGATLVMPTTALLQQLLDEFGLRHSIDEDGDLVIRWEKYSVYFFSYGTDGELLQARAYLNRRLPVESRAGLIVVLDDWNRTKLAPKAYTVLPDDGMVGICAEQCYDFEAGATRAQLKYTVGAWIESLMRFVEWVDDQV